MGVFEKGPRGKYQSTGLPLHFVFLFYLFTNSNFQQSYLKTRIKKTIIVMNYKRAFIIGSNSVEFHFQHIPHFHQYPLPETRKL